MGKALVLFFDHFPKPSERFLHREVCSLKARGHEIEVAALNSVRSELLPCPVRVVYADDYSPLDRFRSFLSVSYWGRGFAAIPLLDLKRAAFLLKRPSAFGCFARRFKEARAIHSMNAGYCGLAAWAVADTLGVPFSFSCHARDVFVQRRILKFLAGMAERIITCSETAKQFIVESNPAVEEKLRLVHHPLPELKPRLEDERVPGRIVAVGRPVPKKDFATLLAAFELLKEEYPDVTLELIGPAAGSLPELPQGATARGTVQFCDVEKILRTATVLVHTSLVAPDGDRDGIPNAIIEAMALGVPVVASDAGGISEVVKDGQTGLLVTQRDANAIAGSVKKLFEDKGLAERLSAAALIFVNDEFNSQTVIPQLEDALGLGRYEG